MKQDKNTKINELKNDLLKTVFTSILTSLIVLGILYLFNLRYIEEFLPKYGYFIFFSILSYSIIIPSIIHVQAYKEFQCMSGMMIGMTIGMISGFLPGFYVASTNGMFWGSIFGMSIGIIFGIFTGKSCGIMGVMEGSMAGFMGGLMGAMTAIMMFNDNLKAISIILFIVSSFILIVLNIMIYKETKEMERKSISGTLLTISLSIILTLVTILLTVFGPRSVLFR